MSDSKELKPHQPSSILSKKGTLPIPSSHTAPAALPFPYLPWLLLSALTFLVSLPLSGSPS